MGKYFLHFGGKHNYKVECFPLTRRVKDVSVWALASVPPVHVDTPPTSACAAHEVGPKHGALVKVSPAVATPNALGTQLAELSTPLPE